MSNLPQILLQTMKIVNLCNSLYTLEACRSTENLTLKIVYNPSYIHKKNIILHIHFGLDKTNLISMKARLLASARVIFQIDHRGVAWIYRRSVRPLLPGC